MIYRIDPENTSHITDFDNNETKLLNGSQHGKDWISYSVRLINRDDTRQYIYMNCYGELILTKEAVYRLKSLFGTDVEYLPLIFGNQELYLLNVLRVIACLDLEKSIVATIPVQGEQQIIDVLDPMVKEPLIPDDATVFVAEEFPHTVFFTEIAKRFIEEHCPHEFVFEQVKINTSSDGVSQQIANNEDKQFKSHDQDNGANTALRAMAEWLADPAEFGQAPLHTEVITHQLMEWPFFDTPQHVFLVDYTMPNKYHGIGFTGPITWSFLGDIPFDDFTQDELIELYAGWYILFCTINQPGYQSPVNKKEEANFITTLRKKGYSQVAVHKRWRIGRDIYYEILLTKDNISYRLAGSVRHHSIFRADDKLMSLPAIYAYLGHTFLKG